MKKILLISIVLIQLCSVCFAASPWTEETTYLSKVRGKMLYGVANFFGGWISLFNEPQMYAEDRKNIFLGIGRGIYKAVVITAGGVVHFVTAPLTFLDIPLPDNGVDM
jgi:hypothetical protein